MLTQNIKPIRLGRMFAVLKEGAVESLLKILTPNFKILSKLTINSDVVTPAGFEPAIFWMRTRYPRPLDDGAANAH
jgi:hypothetical protein